MANINRGNKGRVVTSFWEVVKQLILGGFLEGEKGMGEVILMVGLCNHDVVRPCSEKCKEMLNIAVFWSS